MKGISVLGTFEASLWGIIISLNKIVFVRGTLETQLGDLGQVCGSLGSKLWHHFRSIHSFYKQYMPASVVCECS